MKQFFSQLELKRDYIANWSMSMGSLIIFFLASLLVTVSTTFFLGSSIGWAQFISSMVMALGLSFDLVNNIKINGGGKNIGLRLLGGFALLVLVSILIATPFYDISFDGQNYHQEGIIQLKEGWNPHKSALPSTVNAYTSRFTGHFAKGSWYIDACFYAITGHIQSGKASNILYIVTGILMTLTFLLKTTSIKVYQAVLISLIIGFNPIWANQFLSFYVDGQVSTCFIVIIASLIGIYLGTYNKYLLYFVAGSSIIILSNLKFTGPVFSAVLIAGFCILLIVKKRVSEAIQAGIILALFGLVGVLYVGYGTYVVNFLTEGNPFYPLSQEDILSYQTPINFKGNPGILSLFQSIFSESGLVEVESASVYKIPFTVSLDELKIFVREEPRTGGFGPFFSGGFILVIIAFLLVWLGERKNPSLAIWLSWAFLFASVIIIPAAWWARYVPQFYLLVAWIGIWAFVSSEKAWLKHVILGIWIVFAINTTLIKGIYTFNVVQKTIEINQQLNTYSGKTVCVDFGIFQATRVRFIEKGIPFEETTRAGLLEKCYSSAEDLAASYGNVKVCVKK